MQTENALTSLDLRECLDSAKSSSQLIKNTFGAHARL